jgi:hypothetical protein
MLKLASEALNALMFCAVLTHRSVRTICEEGWTPIASVLNRTLPDIYSQTALPWLTNRKMPISSDSNT